MSLSLCTSAPHAPELQSSLGVKGAKAPGGAGERGAPDRRAALRGGRPCPAPRRSFSRATPGGSAPSARASFPRSPPCHPQSIAQFAGARSPALTAPGGEQRAREPRAAAGGASAALTAAPAARVADQAARGGGGGEAPAASLSPVRHPGPPRGPPARRRQVPPRGAVSCQPLPLPPSPRVEPGPGRLGAGGGGAVPVHSISALSF